MDNYDSFTFNLYQAVAFLGGNPVVYKNDEIPIAEIEKLKPTHIIISPGPGTAVNEEDFRICRSVIRESKVPLLGVCLGHQGIVAEFGGKIAEAPKIMHGKTSKISLDTTCPIFKGQPKEIEAMRYHSLIGDSIPKDLKVVARAGELVMGVQHIKKPTFGIQFHPESFKTPEGNKILKNFLAL